MIFHFSYPSYNIFRYNLPMSCENSPLILERLGLGRGTKWQYITEEKPKGAERCGIIPNVLSP